MEEFYTIKDNYAKIILPKDIYPLVCVEKALTNFLEENYIKIDNKKENLIIQLVGNKDGTNLEKTVGEFYNECLREVLRYNIAVETKNLRELIVGRALYTTCIELEEEQDVQTKEINNNIEAEEYSLDDIAVNWFDKYLE